MNFLNQFLTAASQVVHCVMRTSLSCNLFTGISYFFFLFWISIFPNFSVGDCCATEQKSRSVIILSISKTSWCLPSKNDTHLIACHPSGIGCISHHHRRNYCSGDSRRLNLSLSKRSTDPWEETEIERCNQGLDVNKSMPVWYVCVRLIYT